MAAVAPEPEVGSAGDEFQRSALSARISGNQTHAEAAATPPPAKPAFQTPYPPDAEINAEAARLLDVRDPARNPFFDHHRFHPCTMIRWAIAGLVLVPLRVVWVLLTIFILWVGCFIATMCRGRYLYSKGRYQRPPSPCCNRCLRRWTVAGGRCVLLGFGVWYLRVRRLDRPPRLRRGCCGGGNKVSGVVAPLPPADADSPHAVVVANHTGFLDALAMKCVCDPVLVAKAPIARHPFIGTVLKACGTVFVKRRDPTSRAQVLAHLTEHGRRIMGDRMTALAGTEASSGPAGGGGGGSGGGGEDAGGSGDVVVPMAAVRGGSASEGKSAEAPSPPRVASGPLRKARRGGGGCCGGSGAGHQVEALPPIGMFPEATTTNGQLLIQFRTGAFRAGMPVKPLLVSHSHRWFSPCWTMLSMPKHIILLICQFYNDLCVTVLPTYVPSPQEQRDPVTFANGVRRAMADASGMGISNLSFKHGLAYYGMLPSH